MCGNPQNEHSAWPQAGRERLILSSPIGWFGALDPEGLGLDDSATSHMWRTMIWPNNFL